MGYRIWGFRVRDLGFGVEGPGTEDLRIWGLGFGDAGCRILCILWFRA